MQKNESMMDILFKGATEFIKTKTSQKKSQLEMGSKLMLKRIEQESDPMFQMKKQMAQQYQKQISSGNGQLESDTQRYMRTRRPIMKGGKVGLGLPEQREIYNYLTKKKEVSPKKFDKDDEELLTSLGQKLGFAQKEKEPSWKQEQEIESIKAELKQGRVTSFNVQGIPFPQDVKTRKEALQALGGTKYPPSLFEEELNTYYPEEFTLPEGMTELPEGITEEQIKKAREKHSDEEIVAYFKGS